MNFYSELSSVYDIVFPLEEDTVNFLSEDLKSGYSVMDLACGTGEYSIALAKSASYVLGIDLNSDMIKIAKEKAGDLNVSFIEKDMTTISSISDKKYNLVFCIGNSIVHLNNKDKIKKLIQDIYNTLSDNGVLIIQTVNFDRILKYNIDSLPPINRIDEGVSLIRKYRYDAEVQILNFITELTIKDETDEKKYINSVPLIMLLKNEIVSMLKEAGFKSIEVYGGFDKREYSEDSYAMVIKAFK